MDQTTKMKKKFQVYLVPGMTIDFYFKKRQL